MRTATPRLPRALAASAVAAALVLLVLPAAAQAAPSPWWQLLSSSRPSNLALAPDQTETQEVKTAKLTGVLSAVVEINGEAIGCLGAGVLAGGLPISAEEFCELTTGFPAAETAAQFEEMLEGPYGAGEVEVSGGPAAAAPFTITTPGRWVAPVEVTGGTFTLGSQTVPLGTASAEVKSEGSGRLVATLTNLGNAPLDATKTPLEILDRLPQGVSAYGVGATAGGLGKSGPVGCAIEAAEVRCSFAKALAPYEAIEIEIFVALGPDAEAGKAGEVSVSGGNGPDQSAPQVLHVSDEEVPFGIEQFSTAAEEEGGEPTAQAGAHPFQLTTTIVANSGPQQGAGPIGAHVVQPALPRNLRFTLPAGLVGNATAVPTCDMVTFLGITDNLVNECPDDSAVGVSSVTVVTDNLSGLARLAVPVFNLPPRQGEPARFGLVVAASPVLIDTSVDPSDSYRIRAEVHNITQVAQFLAATTTLWGVPGAKAHDASRGWNCAYFGAETLPGECTAPLPSERHDTPLLRMPVSCSSELLFGADFEPWNAPAGSVQAHASSISPPLLACDREPFDPALSLATTSRLASAPSGLDAEVSMPNAGLSSPGAETSETQFKRAEVILPEGVSLNPSQAEGLATCSEAAYARERYGSAPGDGCPEASKIGSVEVSTPLIEEKLNGALYVATPYENPTGGLIALYLVARVPDRGVLVKQVGKVEPDPRTGQLRTVFDDVPQIPFSSFKLHFREGARSPLVTPPHCGAFQATARFVPWSAQDPESPDPSEVVTRTAPFAIERGTDGGACPSAGPPPFHPGLLAGTINNAAGTFSPFDVRLTRTDAEQEITHFSIKLPPGIVAKLAGVPYCPDADIQQAKERTGPQGGQEEIDHPSCPAASEVGRSLAGAGVGQVLAYAPGKIYLAGPYHGSKLSIAAITAAKVGPFDLGTVVIREALQIDPETAEVFIDATGSDPIPHIIQGVPVHLRDIRAYVDRPDFVLNPTDCTRTSTASTVLGSGLDFASEADDNPVTVTSPFQAADCAALRFKPQLGLRLKGGTNRGAHPAFSAHLKMTGIGEAGIASAQVTLPRSEFIENAHFKTICTRVQFKAGAGNGEQCPEGSIYGHARAVTPILSEPLEGPVFLRSSEHQLPDLVVALHNSQVDFDLVGRVDSVKGGGLRNTFEASPDAPVSSFDLYMAGGKKGLFVNSTDLCRKAYRAKAVFTGQNGKVHNAKPVLRVKCPKKHRLARSGRHG